MTGVITWVVDCGDGVCIEREQPSTAPVLMTFTQRSFDLRRRLTNTERNEVRNSSWLADYLRQQLEDARRKAAEDLAADDESNRFDNQADLEETLDSKAEQIVAEQATYEELKQALKANADLIYEGSSNFIGWCFDTSNMFLDVGGGVFYTGAGGDAIYQHGPGEVLSGQGSDVVFASQDYSDSLLGGDVQTIMLDARYKFEAMCGEYGNDYVFGGEGSQKAYGMLGKDYFDLGNGHDIACGGGGADEFIVDLNNTGRDTIIDFVDVGDKITVLKNGQVAQAGDWHLTESETYNGMNLGADDYAVPYFAQNQKYYHITKSNGDVAAIFAIGAKAGNAISNYTNNADPVHYKLSAYLGSDGIEIFSSCQCATQDQASLSFF